MGLLQRRSVFLNEEGACKKDKSRGRKSSMPSSKSPPQVEAPELPKRKSLVNMIKSWKRDENTPPAPSLPMPNAPFSRNRDSMLDSPTSPGSPFSARPMSQVGGGVSQAGVCSTFPVQQQRMGYPSSITLPNFIPGPRRFYNRGGYNNGAPGALDSTSSFGASRSTLHIPSQNYPSSPMTISSPIPGVGDVPPISYNSYAPPPTEIGVALTPPPGSPHAHTLKKRESRQRVARLSTQTTHTVITSSSHTSHTGHTVASPLGASSSQSPMASRTSLLPPSNRQSVQSSYRKSTQTIKPPSSKRVSVKPGSKRQSEADFLLDAEVAALISESHMPPPPPSDDAVPPVPGIPAALAALEGRANPEGESDRRIAKQSMLPVPRSLNSTQSMLPPPRSKAVQSMMPEPRIAAHQSMLPVPPPRRSSARTEQVSLPPPPRQPVPSLRPPPRAVEAINSSVTPPGMHFPAVVPPIPSPSDRSSPSLSDTSASTERLPAPISPRPDSLLSTASWGSSAASRQSGKTGRVERGGIPWMREASPALTPHLSPSLESSGTEHVEALNEGPKKSPRISQADDESMRSTSSLSHCPTSLLSPVSSTFDEMAMSPSMSMSGDLSGLGLGVLVPGPRNTSPTREIAGLRNRNSALETTNARLEAELRHHRSVTALRTASVYSVQSSLTVRDDVSIGWPSPSISNGSSYDLAMPALVAEIDQLKRSGQMLQAELQAVKSQVSLLLPPTPQELAETEIKDGYIHGEKYVPSSAYIAPAGRVQEIHSEDQHDSDADDERDTPTPHADRRVENGSALCHGHGRQVSMNGNSDLENSLDSHTSGSSTYSTSSADSMSPLTPDTSTDWPVLPSITSLTVTNGEDSDKAAFLSSEPRDRSSVISVTRGGAPLTKLPVRTHSRMNSRNGRIAPVNVTKANSLASNAASDPTTPKATTPKATTPKARYHTSMRNSVQPPPRSAITPRQSVYTVRNSVAPPPRPPRRRPIPTAVQRDTIVGVAAGA